MEYLFCVYLDIQMTKKSSHLDPPSCQRFMLARFGSSPKKEVSVKSILKMAHRLVILLHQSAQELLSIQLDDLYAHRRI